MLNDNCLLKSIEKVAARQHKGSLSEGCSFSGNFSSNEAAEESNEGCRIAAFLFSVVIQARARLVC